MSPFFFSTSLTCIIGFLLGISLGIISTIIFQKEIFKFLSENTIIIILLIIFLFLFSQLFFAEIEKNFLEYLNSSLLNYIRDEKLYLELINDIFKDTTQLYMLYLYKIYLKITLIKIKLYVIILFLLIIPFIITL
jgi:hypothetical protein